MKELPFRTICAGSPASSSSLDRLCHRARQVVEDVVEEVGESTIVSSTNSTDKIHRFFFAADGNLVFGWKPSRGFRQVDILIVTLLALWSPLINYKLRLSCPYYCHHAIWGSSSRIAPEHPPDRREKCLQTVHVSGSPDPYRDILVLDQGRYGLLAKTSYGLYRLFTMSRTHHNSSVVHNVGRHDRAEC